jgi:hypothetical protein
MRAGEERAFQEGGAELRRHAQQGVPVGFGPAGPTSLPPPSVSPHGPMTRGISHVRARMRAWARQTRCMRRTCNLHTSCMPLRLHGPPHAHARRALQYHLGRLRSSTCPPTPHTCVRACVRACARACVRASERASARMIQHELSVPACPHPLLLSILSLLLSSLLAPSSPPVASSSAPAACRLPGIV